MDPSVRQVLEHFFAQAAERLGAVLSAEVALGEVAVEEGWPPVDDAYVATLAMERPQPHEIFLVLDRPCAQACGGLLVMMQEKVIQEKIASGDVDEDDLESIGEATSQLASLLDEGLREALGVESHVLFADGDLESEPREGRWAHGVASLKVGELCEGKLACVLPADGFASDKAPADGESPRAAGVAGGVELSPEEMAAIREATREGALQGGGAVAVLLPVMRSREEWELLCQGAGLTPEFARDLYQVRKLCRAGQVRAIVVDGDMAPGGGVPAVLQLRRWAEVAAPVLVAASRPTRRHVVACMAAGAATYLVKPLAAGDFAQRVDEITATWEQFPRSA